MFTQPQRTLPFTCDVSVLTQEKCFKFFIHSFIPPFNYLPIRCLLRPYCVQNTLRCQGFLSKTKIWPDTALCFQWLPIASCRLQAMHTMFLSTCMFLFTQFLSLDYPSSWSRWNEMSLPLWSCPQTYLGSHPRPMLACCSSLSAYTVLYTSSVTELVTF